MEALKKGEMTRENVLAVMNQAVWGEDISARWDPKDDSERLGLGLAPSSGGVSLVDEIQRMDDTAWRVWESPPGIVDTIVHHNIGVWFTSKERMIRIKAREDWFRHWSGEAVDRLGACLDPDTEGSH